MFEDDVDPLLFGDPAGLVLETILAIVDDVVGAERFHALDFGVITDGGDDGAADRLGHHDGDGSDAGAAGMHQHGLTALQFGVVEQHVLHGRECDRRAGSVALADAVRHRNHQPFRQIDEFAGETVDMEAHDAGDILAKIVAALLAGRTNSAGEGAVHHHLLSRLEARDTFADGCNFAGGFGADDQRQLALGKRHAAIAPDIDVIERNRLDFDLHLVRARRRRRRHLRDHQLTIGNKSEGTHDVVSPARRRMDDRVRIAGWYDDVSRRH